MATTGPFLGNSLLLYVNGTAIAHSRTCSVSMTTDEVDVTSKDSAKKFSMLPGRMKVTISCDGLVALDSASNAPLLSTTLKAGTAVAWKLSTNVSGDDYWHGATAYVTSIEISGAENDATTFSATLSVSGDWNVTQKT